MLYWLIQRLADTAGVMIYVNQGILLLEFGLVMIMLMMTIMIMIWLRPMCMSYTAAGGKACPFCDNTPALSLYGCLS